ncbi:MAG: GNAT family N-acetyltransferase [Phyllobacterium sp.]
MAAIPVLETERLVLRAHRIDDFNAYHAIWSDPEIVRFITGKPSTEEESWGRLLNRAGHWHMLGFGFWAIEDKASGALIGEAGFLNARREIEPPLDGSAEMGWALLPCYQGKGLAMEAITAALEWGKSNLDFLRATCIISPDNAPSLRLAERCGYRQFAQTTYKASPVILLERQLIAGND